MTIFLDFSEPMYVSAYEEKDDMDISVDHSLFSFDDQVRITKEEVEMVSYRGFMVRQVSAEQLAMIESVGDASSGFLSVFMSTNVFLSIFMIQLLQYLWGLINTLQMIVIIVLFNVQFPLNTAQILIDIMALSNLDLFEVDGYITAMFNFGVQTKAFNEKFDAAGFETSTFTIELGMIFFIVLFSFAFLVFKQILKLATYKCGINWLTRRLR